MFSKSLTSLALTAFLPFIHNWRNSSGRPLNSGTSATYALPCFFHPFICTPPLTTALPSAMMRVPLSSGLTVTVWFNR